VEFAYVGTDTIQNNLSAAAVYLGGPLSVAIAMGYGPAFLSETASSKRDRELAGDCVKAAFEAGLLLFDEDEIDWEAVSKANILSSLREHWSSVKAVASALCKKPYFLSGEEVTEIIQRAEGVKF